MDRSRLDRLTRSVSILLSRRTLAGALGLATLAIPHRIDAKAKRKKKKIKRNSFGCVDAGKFCKNRNQCCSGICSGKKGKKRCQAHDTGGCQPLKDPICDGLLPTCTTSTGDDGLCLTTTGKAAYCAFNGDCIVCKKDADCVAFCGPQAACIPCTDGSCDHRGGTVCAGTSPESCHPLRQAQRS